MAAGIVSQPIGDGDFGIAVWMEGRHTFDIVAVDRQVGRGIQAGVVELDQQMEFIRRDTGACLLVPLAVQIPDKPLTLPIEFVVRVLGALWTSSRSEERRVGQECVRKGSSRWVTYH